VGCRDTSTDGVSGDDRGEILLLEVVNAAAGPPIKDRETASIASAGREAGLVLADDDEEGRIGPSFDDDIRGGSSLLLPLGRVRRSRRPDGGRMLCRFETSGEAEAKDGDQKTRTSVHQLEREAPYLGDRCRRREGMP